MTKRKQTLVTEATEEVAESGTVAISGTAGSCRVVLRSKFEFGLSPS
jgi:hypothetical protein